MRHLAWLGAVPQPKARKRLQDREDEPALTRLEKMQSDGVDPSMPPCRSLYLVNLLMEIGPIEPAGADSGPIGWSTLRDWQGSTSTPLEPWQVRLLRRLSSDFLIESRAARDADRPAPWGAVTPGQRDVVDTKIRSLFGGLARVMRRPGR